jgi:hypothetical protein
MVRYDLHCHSTASDGTLTPAEVVHRAWERGVEVLALTDHDCTDGLAEAGAKAASLSLTLVPGVEISVTWEEGQVIHVVGLHVDPEAPALQAGLLRLQEFRQGRAQEIGRRLAAQGIPSAFEGARALARGASVARTHFARFLVAEGHGRDITDVFDHFLVRGKPGYVAGQWADLAECIGWIRAAGGQAVLAHPARYPLTATRLRQLLGQFRDCGGVGLEVISGSSRDDCQTLAHYARTFGLMASVGSDFHSPGNPRLDLGQLPDLPSGVRPMWADWS